MADQTVSAENITDTGSLTTPIPTIHVISDSVGVTAKAVARAAAAQFGESNPKIEVMSKAKRFADIKTYIDMHEAAGRQKNGDGRILVFFTLVDRNLRRQLIEYAEEDKNIVLVDLMTNAVEAISNLSGRCPAGLPGSLHTIDSHYFQRVEALEFTIAHDDGRNPQELTRADIVLLGVSRSSKTPVSIYLSQQGYKVANVPLDPSTEPPREIYEVDRTRLFGLMTTPDVLVGIRRKRLGNAGGVASKYADPEYVYEDLERARALMRKLGCIVVHTENKALEETAQEILGYYERVHPPSGVMH